MRPRRRRGILWWGKCGAAIGCVLVVALFVANARWDIHFVGDTWVAWVEDGALWLVWNLPTRRRPDVERWMVTRSQRTAKLMQWWPSVDLAVGSSVLLPLWVVFVLIAVPTALLWHRDRRRVPPGHCRNCSYDLTGNVSGRCPECGVAIRG